jgi:hypothetical protein
MNALLEYIEYTIEQMVIEDYIQIDYEYWQLDSLSREVWDQLDGVDDYNRIAAAVMDNFGNAAQANHLNIVIQETVEGIQYA